MQSGSHDLGAVLRMHSFTVDCDTFSNEENAVAVFLVISIVVEVTGYVAMSEICFSTLLLMRQMKRLLRSLLG